MWQGMQVEIIRPAAAVSEEALRFSSAFMHCMYASQEHSFWNLMQSSYLLFVVVVPLWSIGSAVIAK